MRQGGKKRIIIQTEYKLQDYKEYIAEKSVLHNSERTNVNLKNS